MEIQIETRELKQALRHIEPAVPKNKFFRKIYLRVKDDKLIIEAQNNYIYYREEIDVFISEKQGERRMYVDYEDLKKALKEFGKSALTEISFDDGLILNDMYIRSYDPSSPQWKPINESHEWYIGNAHEDILKERPIHIKDYYIFIPDVAEKILKNFKGIIEFKKIESGICIINKNKMVVIKQN